MGKIWKKIFVIVGILVILAVAGLQIAKYLIREKVEKYINHLPSHIQVQYEGLDIDIFNGNLTIEKPMFKSVGQTTKKKNAEITMQALQVEDFSIWNYLMHDAISINAIQVKSPKGTYYHNPILKSETYRNRSQTDFKWPIEIGSFNISDANLVVINAETDSLIFKTSNLKLKLSSIEMNRETSKKSIPIDFKTIDASSENLFYSLNDFENLSVASLNLNQETSVFSGLAIKTKYSKTELSKHIKVERDHIDLSIPTVEIKNPHVGFRQDSIFAFKVETVILSNPNFNIYRNKLLPDDYKVKSLYSKMLRELNCDLTLNKIDINNGTIIYEEKVKLENEAGTLKFSNLDAYIEHVGNTYASGVLTTLDIQSVFMENTPLKVDWGFDVNNSNDRFLFKANLGILQAEHLNQFMQPNLNIKLEGELLKTYFTIDGNVNTSQIDLKTDYDNFDVIILRENGVEKNKLLSALVNLFISKDSNDKPEDFRFGSKSEVERDKTKSIFNFIWKSTRAGLLSAMTGDGKKD